MGQHACPRCYEPMREIEITRGNDVNRNGPAPLVWMGPSTGTRLIAEGFFQATRDDRLQLLAEYRGFWIHETAYRWISDNVPPYVEWCAGPSGNTAAQGEG